jgi:hypothetical protein
MALSDPQTVTISAVAIPLPRTFAEGDESHYTSSDGLVQLSVNHTLAKGSRARRLVRLDHSKLTSDPFKPSENVKVSMGHYMVFDLPPAGYTNAEALAVYTGFKTLYTASTDALITKLLGGES